MDQQKNWFFDGTYFFFFWGNWWSLKTLMTFDSLDNLSPSFFTPFVTRSKPFVCQIIQLNLKGLDLCRRSLSHGLLCLKNSIWHLSLFIPKLFVSLLSSYPNVEILYSFGLSFIFDHISHSQITTLYGSSLCFFQSDFSLMQTTSWHMWYNTKKPLPHNFYSCTHCVFHQLFNRD